MSGLPWGQTGQKIVERSAISDEELPEELRLALEQHAAAIQSEFQAPSKKALQASLKKARTATGVEVWAEIKQAFENCPAGMSFRIPKKLVEHNLRVMVSRRAKKMNRLYSVVVHPNEFEIYRRE